MTDPQSNADQWAREQMTWYSAEPRYYLGKEGVDDVRIAISSLLQWVEWLIDEADIDPEETAFKVNAVGPDGSQELVCITLTDSLTRARAALAIMERKG